MDRIRRYIKAYNELKTYRSGHYAAEFARNNLRNTLLIVVLLLAIIFVDCLMFAVGDAVPLHRKLLLLSLFATLGENF